MRTRWAKRFIENANAQGLRCTIINWELGWPETMALCEETYFVKTVTYNASRKEYFVGVDPKKLEDRGDFVLICGGINSTLRDIFIIPWKVFFQILTEGKPVNTYKSPKEYWQYKLHIRDRNAKWVITVQARQRPEVNISRWRYDPNGAIEQLKRT